MAGLAKKLLSLLDVFLVVGLPVLLKLLVDWVGVQMEQIQETQSSGGDAVANEEHCIFCGNDSPEGRQVCPICEGKIRRRKSIRESETELILAEENAKAQREKDIIHLKLIALSIKPYSRWWRWGYLGSVRRAIKALEREEKP